MNRRKLFTWMAVVLLASSGASTMTGCTKTRPRTAQESKAPETTDPAATTTDESEEVPAVQDEPLTEEEFRAAIIERLGDPLKELGIDPERSNLEDLMTLLQSLIEEQSGDGNDLPEAVEKLPAESQTEIEVIVESEEPTTEPYEGEIVGTYSMEIDEDHPEVRKYIRVFSQNSKVAPRIQRSLNRSARYIPMIKKKLKAAGLPEDLAWLCLIESGFRTRVQSHASARGMWQFIPGTGRRYNLEINEWVDERCDPVKATYAAIGYLTDLHEEFGDWRLALASYNCGEGRVRREIRRRGTRDFWRLSELKALPKETRGYVPAFKAAVIIGNDPEKYGFTTDEKAEPWSFETITVDRATDLELVARAAKTTKDEIIDLNPELNRWFTPGNVENYQVRVPKGSAEGFLARFNAIPKEERVTWGTHVVRRGEQLSTIARRYGTSISKIARVNKIQNINLLRIGQRLIVPNGPLSKVLSPKDQASEFTALQTRRYTKPEPKKANKPKPTSGEIVTYRVRKGDTIARIAQRFGVSEHHVISNNGITNPNLIRLGTELKIVPNGSRSTTRVVPEKYTVRRGDSLWEIGNEFGITLHELTRANGLSSRARIVPGQELKIPGGGRTITNVRPQSLRADANREKIIHTVRNGESAWTIASKYGVTMDEVLAANNLSRRSTLKPGQKLTVYGKGSPRAGATTNTTPRDSGNVHTVRNGESPWIIANRHGVSLDALLKLNGLTKRSTVQPGQKLKLPGATTTAGQTTASASGGMTHTVEKGDSLWVIANKYGVELNALITANNLSRRATLQPGQRIRIP